MELREALRPRGERVRRLQDDAMQRANLELELGAVRLLMIAGDRCAAIIGERLTVPRDEIPTRSGDSARVLEISQRGVTVELNGVEHTLVVRRTIRATPGE